MELSVRLPDSDSVVLVSVAAQGIHCGTYIVSHVVGHDATWLCQANGVKPPLQGLFSSYKVSWRSSTGLPDVFN